MEPQALNGLGWTLTYILTLNVDRIAHATDEVWYDDLQRCVVASFTKAERFLNTTYQEVR